jgi:putative membrane protein
MLSEQDRSKIQHAVEAAERRTRGEIVPMVVSSSARYREAQHLAGLVAIFLTLGFWFLFREDLDRLRWGGMQVGGMLLAILVAYLLGTWLGSASTMIRMLTSDPRMDRKVRLRAEQAFYRKGLHKTQGGTGVLIFISVLERRVVVLADQAINARVPAGTWDAVVTQLTMGIREGRLTEALCLAIHRCGEILAQHFPARPGENPNELRNEVIQD